MLVLLTITVLLLVVFPGCLYGLGWLISSAGHRAPRSRPSAEVPQWMRNPPVSWKKTFL